METINEQNVVIQPINKSWYKNRVAALDVLRLDLLHPVISGNKWYKLRLNIEYAIEKGYSTILTFGGGFSNHLVATAYAASLFGLKSIGIVRGKYNKLTPTLEDCIGYGMEVMFVSKEDYNNKQEPGWLDNLVGCLDNICIIPEGGANENGREGAGLIGSYFDNSYTHIVTAIGSGTTLIGLRNKLDKEQQVLGFAPFKNAFSIKDHINTLINEDKKNNWDLYDEWHFGGFGKWNDTLLRFMSEFYLETKIPLDIIYTSKMMYGISEMLRNNYFSLNDKILCIHSGGLQGNVSVREKLVY